MNTVERHFTDTGQRVLLKAKNPNDEYFSHKVFKDKAELCRVSMPYCLSDEEPAPKPFKLLNKK